MHAGKISGAVGHFSLGRLRVKESCKKSKSIGYIIRRAKCRLRVGHGRDTEDLNLGAAKHTKDTTADMKRSGHSGASAHQRRCTSLYLYKLSPACATCQLETGRGDP